jgi:hypothetical protein
MTREMNRLPFDKADVDPSPADTNRDGKIIVEEYALWIQSRQNR